MSSRYDDPPHRRRSRSPVRRDDRSGGRDYRSPRGDHGRERDREPRDYRDRDREALGRDDRSPRSDWRDRDRERPAERDGRVPWHERESDDRRAYGRPPRERDARDVPPPRARYDPPPRGGGRGGGRDTYGRREPSPPRVLDRRAIEEGRRKREEERARGVVFAEDGTKIEPKVEEEESTPAPEVNEDMDEEAAAIASMMGFGGFGTTKNKEVDGNADGAVKVNKKRTWRQYMNRRGGFNRALDTMK